MKDNTPEGFTLIERRHTYGANSCLVKIGRDRHCQRGGTGNHASEERFDNNPGNTKERRRRALGRDEFLCLTGLCNGHMQGIESG
jgi:hypothetical protein